MIRTATFFVTALLAVSVSLADDGVSILPSDVSLFAGHSQQLLISRSRGEAEEDLTSRVFYRSLKPQVVSVSANGLLEALAAGQATIELRLDDELLDTIDVQVAAAEEAPPVRFVTDVVPLLTKLGCNSGGCHGKATGQNGFKLSLLGFEPASDYQALVNEARGRRLFPGAPERSLLLLKATAQMPHGGGRRLEEGSEEYRLLQRWIARGGTRPRNEDPELERLELTPREGVINTSSRQQLLVTAHFSDGSSHDVTRRAVYLSNEPGIAGISNSGLVQTTRQNGLFAIMVRFGGKIASFHGAVPFTTSVDEQREVVAQLDALGQQLASPVDRRLWQQWRRLQVAPSPPADDATFIRRVTLDICGSLPTPEETRAYVNDKRPDKRARLIDGLLERPEYASYFALKWADILRNRGAGYSTSKQRAGTALFANWIRNSIAANQPYDQFVAEIITASGSQNENPPTVWYRSVRTPTDYVESVAQAFLGVRIQCAQCHHHPFERWSQEDYYALAAVFARVGRKGGFADAEVPTNEVIYLKDPVEVKHPRTGLPVRPRGLGGAALGDSRYDDPRRPLRQLDDRTRQSVLRPHHGQSHVGSFPGTGNHPPDRRFSQYQSTQ